MSGNSQLITFRPQSCGPFLNRAALSSPPRDWKNRRKIPIARPLLQSRVPFRHSHQPDARARNFLVSTLGERNNGITQRRQGAKASDHAASGTAQSAEDAKNTGNRPQRSTSPAYSAVSKKARPETGWESLRLEEKSHIPHPLKSQASGLTPISIMLADFQTVKSSQAQNGSFQTFFS
jgi:hypothetical protein